MRRGIYLGALAAAVPMMAAAAMSGSLRFDTGSRVWVEGTSTTRGYRCEAPSVSGAAQAPSVRLSELAAGTHRGEVTIEVANLDCRNGTMNGHMRRALKADEHATIRFQATSVQVTPAADGQSAVRMRGQPDHRRADPPRDDRGDGGGGGRQLRVAARTGSP
jgi:polyisoprenoid-binding protein YceI